jgi:hypothetical protein
MTGFLTCMLATPDLVQKSCGFGEVGRGRLYFRPVLLTSYRKPNTAVTDTAQDVGAGRPMLRRRP